MRFSPKRFRAEVVALQRLLNLSNVCTQSSGCVDGNLDRQFDGGKATVYGLEAYVESEIQLFRKLTLPGRLAYTFTEARFDSVRLGGSDLRRCRGERRDPYIPSTSSARRSARRWERYA
ncbi:MAG: hypothetical protein R3B70_18295 [Polyangiaceae bacterium]